VLVAEVLMESSEVAGLEICPWSTRGGLLLERLRAGPGASGRHHPAG
jgi:exopolyphosphatase/guanosine-5'-triphosphate,3'-diphosphate pyrophosphatase